MNGVGIYRWKDGKSFEGMFEKDLKEGFGCFKWPDGRQFKGNWHEGKQHGLGVYIQPNIQLNQNRNRTNSDSS